MRKLRVNRIWKNCGHSGLNFRKKKKRAILQNPTPKKLLQHRWMVQRCFYDEIKAGSLIRIDTSVSIKPTALFFSKSMKTINDLYNRGLTIELLVEPHSPFCFDIETKDSDLIIMDDMGYQLVGDGKFFSTKAYFEKYPDDQEVYLPKAGWSNTITASRGDKGLQFAINARSYVLPSEGAQYIHLMGKLHLKYYTQETYEVDVSESNASGFSSKSFYVAGQYIAFERRSATKGSKEYQVFRLRNAHNVPIVQIAFYDENENRIGLYSPYDDFVFEQSGFDGFIVPKMRITVAKSQTIPVVVDEYISLGIGQNNQN